jgi:8-oxo-dGTP pyrophosphatase MutT (NUDIX family)
MSYRHEIRHKAIVVPIVRHPSETRFLVVRDSRHQEWIFVTGGCKKSEIEYPLRCGLRELEEETRGTVNIKSGEFSEFQFESSHRSPEETRKDRSEGIIVTLVYHVYIINLDITQEQQKSIVHEFHVNKATMEKNKREGAHVKKAYDENDDIAFDTLDDFNRKSRWSLIVKHVIDNPDFYKSMDSSKMQNFNIRSYNEEQGLYCQEAVRTQRP